MEDLLSIPTSTPPRDRASLCISSRLETYLVDPAGIELTGVLLSLLSAGIKGMLPRLA